MELTKSLKGKLGENNLIVKASRVFINEFFCAISLISPKLNCKLRYRYNYGKKLNIDNPETFIEKCNWYKINIVNKNEIFRLCSDKLAVRSYLHDRGCDGILNNLLGVYENVDDIEFDKLPEKFVLKINDGCGYYIICTDNSRFNEEEAKIKLKKWWKEHNYLLYAEMQNKARKRRIIAEEYIEGENGAKQPTDYKVYCFNGIPCAILCVWDRDKTVKELFMSPQWDFISEAYGPDFIKKGQTINNIPKKPKDLEIMLEYARKLSSPFPFVRCDFYQSNKGVIFGELTFTAAGGMFTAQTDPKIMDMKKLFKVPCDFHDIKIKRSKEK